MHDLEKKIEEIFLDLLPPEEANIREMSIVNCLNWDSFFQLNLVVTLEQEFQVTISDEEAPQINSFQMACHIIEDKLSKKESTL